jgi:predicted nucleic-acid-binding protein
MIGLDTNVVVRYLTQDDARQTPIATQFIEKSLSLNRPGFISLIVLAEVVWVLVSLYKIDRRKVIEVVEGLLTTQQLQVDDAPLVWRAVRRYASSKIDFSDALIVESALARGCAKTVTFDKACKSIAGFELLG